MTILTAVFLSIYRIDNNNSTLSHYIAFAAINAIYCSIWDLFMDFSLLQAKARRRLLRDITALRPVWVYYAIMFLDPLLRFSWILYAIFTHNTQHSTLVSFCVALAEVIRRGLWTLLRVENEHCGNVSQYKAARETPLPYKLELASKFGSAQDEGAATQPAATTPLVTASPPTPPPGTAHSQATFPGQTQPLQGPSADTAVPPTTVAHLAAPTLEEGGATSTSVAQQAGLGVTFRRHRRTSTAGRRSILQAMAEAHRQDFEKRRPSIAAGSLHSHEEMPAKRVGAVVAAGTGAGTATVGVGDYLSAAEEEDEDEVAVEDDEEERGHETGYITEGIKSDDDEDEDDDEDGEESEEMREHRTRMRMRLVDGGGGNMDGG